MNWISNTGEAGTPTEVTKYDLVPGTKDTAPQ